MILTGLWIKCQLTNEAELRGVSDKPAAKDPPRVFTGATLYGLTKSKKGRGTVFSAREAICGVQELLARCGTRRVARTNLPN